jgi:hypothetical protein
MVTGTVHRLRYREVMATGGVPHRLDGFDPDDALEKIRELVHERHGTGDELADLFSLLDHWLIVGESPPAEVALARPAASGRVQPYP